MAVLAIAMVATGADRQMLIAIPLLLPYSAFFAYSLVRPEQAMPTRLPIALMVIPGLAGLVWIISQGDFRPLTALIAVGSILGVTLLLRRTAD
jgi:hypothetical protein